MNKLSVSFFTFGCRLNQSETAVIERTFEIDGYRVVDISEPADIVVINTCTVTENGDTDTRRLVNRINRLNPNARIALVGCQAQIQKQKLVELKNVRWVVGNAKKMDLVSILKETEEEGAEKKARVITPPIPRESFTIPTAGIDRTHTRANLKIQDGCDFFCSFCEIPYARGRGRSREFGDILLEARALIAAGHQELVLTGINIGTYAFEQKRLLHVIEALEQVEGLKRIRISSIEPTTIPWELFKEMNKGSKLCRHLHIPIQSGHDEILTAMKRKYTVREFRVFLNRVFQAVPQICIGTDVIVGFPAETEEHFEETYELLRDLPLAYFHVFSYSERQYAKSQNLSGAILRQTIERRSQKMRNLSARKRQLFLKNLLGAEEEVLIEEVKDGFWSGLTDNYIRVKVKSDQDLKNSFVKVRLAQIDGPSVIGYLMETSNLGFQR